jgi:predicted nucleotidyltransferase component of viral defense system
MIGDVLKNRIREYAPANAVEQENVLQELMQHYVLASLSRAGMFSEAIFHGGTCLRIIYDTNRFSEDLDFLLKSPNPAFRWYKFLERVRKDCAQEGIEFEIQDRSKAEMAVQKAFLKTDSIGTLLMLELPFERYNPKKIRIKLEIDTNPPAESEFETSYITFPNTASITIQTLSSGFATKAHALLCRRYIKGRDWYDFLWYVTRKIKPNFPLLRNALGQQGPWAGQDIDLSVDWFVKAIGAAIQQIDWNTASLDVQRFLPTREQESLGEWTVEFFLYQTERLKQYLTDDR